MVWACISQSFSGTCLLSACYHCTCYFFFSSYPSQRVTTDSEGKEVGVAGSLSLQQNVTLSTQPINSFDWSPDKQGLCACTSFDQTVRVLIVTGLGKI